MDISKHTVDDRVTLISLVISLDLPEGAIHSQVEERIGKLSKDINIIDVEFVQDKYVVVEVGVIASYTPEDSLSALKKALFDAVYI